MNYTLRPPPDFVLGLDLFVQPRDRRHIKWWGVELRFTRPLRRREVRVLSRSSIADYAQVGTDGVIWDPWYNSYPGPWDTYWLIRLIRRVKVPARVRMSSDRVSFGPWTVIDVFGVAL